MTSPGGEFEKVRPRGKVGAGSERPADVPPRVRWSVIGEWVVRGLHHRLIGLCTDGSTVYFSTSQVFTVIASYVSEKALPILPISRRLVSVLDCEYRDFSTKYSPIC